MPRVFVPQLLGSDRCMQAAHVCAQKKVPAVKVEVVGCGLMEWSRERDRHLNVCEGKWSRRSCVRDAHLVAASAGW